MKREQYEGGRTYHGWYYDRCDFNFWRMFRWVPFAVMTTKDGLPKSLVVSFLCFYLHYSYGKKTIYGVVIVENERVKEEKRP